MNFKSYKEKFTDKALTEGLSHKEVEALLDYAELLYEKDLPIIYDINHLALLMGIKHDYLYRVSNEQKSFYRTFYIKKSNGKKRMIKEPLPILKKIQTWILVNILDKLPSSVYSKAFKKDFSIKSNARFHQNQKVVICFDIKDYFNSIKEYKVYNFFKSLSYREELCVMLSKLCCLNKSLPQGSPTSPALSNLITIDLDNDLSKFAKSISSSKHNVRYSRYADDITFSGNQIHVSDLIKNTKRILKVYDFNINHNKTRVLKSNKRQLVTGIVVNKKMQVSKTKRKEIRSDMFYIKKFGLSSHMSARLITISPIQYLHRLQGLIDFVLFINPEDNEFINYKKDINSLIVEHNSEDYS